MSDKLGRDLRFYLEHKDEIDEWLRLPERLREETDRFYKSLKDDLDEKKKELSGAPRLSCDLHANRRKLLVHRESWAVDRSFATPLLGVGLEWENLEHNSFADAYVGVRVERHTAENVDGLEGRIRDEFSKTKYDSRPWWPAYQFVPATDGFWKNLDEFGSGVVNEICRLWEERWCRLDELFLEWRNQIRSRQT